MNQLMKKLSDVENNSDFKEEILKIYKGEDNENTND